MAEFRKPELGGIDRGWLVVMSIVLLACMFLSLRSGSRPARDSFFFHTEQRIVQTAHQGSMNVFEEQLFLALAFVQSHLAGRWGGSWGWAIVLLTTGINLLLLPLRVSSMRSGVKMQRIQPAIQAIRARYEGISLTDPRHAEMSAEIARLQKDSGVNALGGCVPLLLQMPLLLAFFGMLHNAPALHGAGWLWLHDLSSPDPHHILPVLMGISQLLVQWTTPSPGSDARQQRIVACLSTVAFGYVSWHYASGLALYVLTGSIVSLATQAVMSRSVVGREMRAVKEASG